MDKSRNYNFLIALFLSISVSFLQNHWSAVCDNWTCTYVYTERHHTKTQSTTAITTVSLNSMVGQSKQMHKNLTKQEAASAQHISMQKADKMSRKKNHCSLRSIKCIISMTHQLDHCMREHGKKKRGMHEIVAFKSKPTLLLTDCWFQFFCCPDAELN